jgi:hypothetical protein
LGFEITNMEDNIGKIKKEFKKKFKDLRWQELPIHETALEKLWDFFEHHLQEERKKTIEEVLEEVGKAKNRTIDKSHREKDQREKSLIRASANGLQGAVNILNLFKQK